MPYLAMELRDFNVNTSTGELQSDLTAPRLYHPADFEEPAGGDLGHAPYVTFAERTVARLTASLEEAYRPGVRAVT